MSTQTLEPPMSDIATSAPESANSGWAVDANSDDFDYTPVSPWGPIALTFGVTSLTAFLNMFGIGLAFLGTIIGIAAVLRIRGERGAMKGIGFAATGLVLSALCFGLGTTSMVHAYQTEVPEGYARYNFPKDVADKQFVTLRGVRRLHPDVAPLIGTKVYLKGYMYQTRSDTGLTEFVFLKDTGECCFGGEPKPYDMMVVRLPEDNPTNAYTGMIAVAGILNADVLAAEGEPVYTFDADIVKEAPTPF